MARLILKNVTKSWHGVTGVDKFTLEVADHEFIVLLGPSGCGKTTTMRMVAGLEQLSSGEIYFDDKLVNKLEPKDRDIAMVFQSYGLYPNLTVYENIRFPLRVRKVDKSLHDSKVRNAAAKVELTRLLERKPKELSGGQRQRVALARAIVREPKVFLMDEPLSNLDAKLRISTRAEIKHLHNELKVTTIYVTHDQIEAMTLADRVVVMSQGLIQQVGTPMEIYNSPKNKFVAGFIGSPAMNLVGGDFSGGVFTAPSLRVEGLQYKHEGKATLGFRSEDASVSLSQEKPDDSCGVIATKIYSVELLGEAAQVSVKIGDSILSVKADKNFQAEIGSDVNIFIAPSKCILFDIANNGEQLPMAS